MSHQSQRLFKVAQFNVENLFLFAQQGLLDQARGSNWASIANDSKSKSRDKTQGLAATILSIDADLYFLNEVGGYESLKHFNEYFLGNRYHPLIIEGNSQRGIDNGYLLKKGLNLNPRLFTHKDLEIDLNYSFETPASGSPPYFFSRDILELRLDLSEGQRLHCLNVHLKSKLDPEGFDSEGRVRRKAELEALCAVYQGLKKTWGEDVKVLIGGDFNGLAANLPQQEPEFKALNQTDLTELFSFAQLAPAARTTQWQFEKSGYKIERQLDYLWASPALLHHLNIESPQVNSLKNKEGLSVSPPESLQARYHLASDHWPISASFTF